MKWITGESIFQGEHLPRNKAVAGKEKHLPLEDYGGKSYVFQKNKRKDSECLHYKDKLIHYTDMITV